MWHVLMIDAPVGSAIGMCVRTLTGHERHPVHWRSDVGVAARVSNWPWVHVVSGTHMCVFIKPLGL